MITIRIPKVISQPTLIGFKATLKTPHAVFEMSSTGPDADMDASFGAGLYGRIAWPRALFRLGSELVLEQQMFVPCDCSDVAISWQLRGNLVPAELTIRPHFAGCEPLKYRNRGFRAEPQENGGRLSWLAHVLGPKIIADTNGRLHEEPLRFEAEMSPAEGGTVCPGVFEFQLTRHPAILIFSKESCTKTQYYQHLGMFLAGLIPRRTPAGTTSIGAHTNSVILPRAA